VLAAALASPCRPWVLFASSREVYGQPARLPVDEDAPIAPVNVYGHAKAVGERLVDEARAVGLRTAVVRLSNVYGSPIDHQDRVVPAFCLAAARGRPIRIDGRDHLFDFTHVADVVAGLMGLIRLLDDGGSPPPIHLLTGRPTSLGRLAAECVDIAGVDLPVIEAPPRDYDVARFHGIPTRARELLGWAARVPLRQGLEGLIRAFRLPVSASVGEGRTS
jgi:nucleoside-diphosphate-sugar epimerase